MNRISSSRHRNDRRKIGRVGLSMLEVVVSLTLVSTILLVSLSASAGVMRNRATVAQNVQGQLLAGYIMDEISTLDFRDRSDQATFGLEPDESTSDRSSMDDMDDYDSFSQQNPTFRDGHAIPGFDGWTVDVDVMPMGSSGPSIVAVADADSMFRLVSVSVTSPQKGVKRYRSLFSNLSSDRPVENSFERLRRVEVRFSDDRKINVVVPLRNTPTPTY